jgi:MFS transporter, putative metabolite:H+ symporter
MDGTNGTKVPSLTARLDVLPVNRWHIYLLSMCCLGMLFDAFDSNMITPMLPKLVGEWKIPNVQVGLIASAGFMGMAIGATLFGAIADKIGRLKVFGITLLWYSILAGFCSLTVGFKSLFAMRMLVGMGLGGLIPVVASYLAEYVPSRKRGQFVSYWSAANQIGAAVAYVVGFAVIVPYGWRVGFLLGVIPAFLCVFVWKGLPESVRYLISKNRVPEAVKVVERLEQRSTGAISVPHETAVRAEKESKPVEAKVRHRDLFKGGLEKTTIMMALLWFAWIYAQFSILMWLPILASKQLGYAVPFTLKLMAIGSVVGVLGQILVGYTADAWGRKVSLLYSYLLLAASVYLIFLLGKDPTVGAVMVFVMFIALGANAGCLFTYTTEIFPTRVRATGSGFSSSMGRVGGICGPTMVGLIYAKFGVWWILHINLFLLVLALVVMLIFGRETKRKTLEQIGEMSLAKVPT